MKTAATAGGDDSDGCDAAASSAPPATGALAIVKHGATQAKPASAAELPKITPRKKKASKFGSDFMEALSSEKAPARGAKFALCDKEPDAEDGVIVVKATLSAEEHAPERFVRTVKHRRKA